MFIARNIPNFPSLRQERNVGGLAVAEVTLRS